MPQAIAFGAALGVVMGLMSWMRPGCDQPQDRLSKAGTL